ncbi:MAG: cob(I)yrinic acid a,c-diamide adenosyltransferase [Verrucomicrobiota bacterium]
MKKRRRSITTGLGDGGMTRLYSGEEVPKDSPRPDVCGDIDELVSALGLARAHAARKESREGVLHVQRSLFIVASELATSPEGTGLLEKRVDADMVKTLEGRRLTLESKVDIPRGFAIPGDSVAAAHLDLARAIARRAERKVVALLRGAEVRNEHLLVWMNRVSDYLWLLARLEEKRSKG